MNIDTESLKLAVYNRIDFPLSESAWCIINRAFINYWDNMASAQKEFSLEQVVDAVNEQLKKEHILLQVDRLSRVLLAMLKYLENIDMAGSRTSEKNMKRAVYGRIDFPLPETTWKLLYQAFDDFWESLGVGEAFYEGQLLAFLDERLKEQHILLPPDHLDRILHAMLDFLEMVGSSAKPEKLLKQPATTIAPVTTMQPAKPAPHVYNADLTFFDFPLPDNSLVLGNIDLSGSPVTFLPSHLTVNGNLDLYCTKITSLPRGLIVKGDLNLRDTPVTALPDDLSVGGSLDLISTEIKNLPDNLVIDGNLNLGYTKITAIPKGLTVKGDLGLSGIPITELPDDLSVGGSLNLSYSEIITLPDNLVVNGDLDLRGAKITALPKGLTVKGNLYLWFVHITEIPGDIIVKGTVCVSDRMITLLSNELNVGSFCWNTVLMDPDGEHFWTYDPKEITFLPDNLTIGGGVDLSASQITALPKGLVVYDTLNLSGLPITTLPADLVVAGSLDLSNTLITFLPGNLVVTGALDLSNTPLTALPDGLTVGEALDVTGTRLTALPDNLTLGGEIFGTDAALIRRAVGLQTHANFLSWSNGLVLCDGIWSKLLNHHGNVWKVIEVNQYNIFDNHHEGDILYIVTDGNGTYAHGRTLDDARDSLRYKLKEDRGKDQYRHLRLDDSLSFDEAIDCYRVITGACHAGTEHFIEHCLPSRQQRYTIREIIHLTRGQYGNPEFAAFFSANTTPSLPAETSTPVPSIPPPTTPGNTLPAISSDTLGDAPDDAYPDEAPF